MVYELLFGYLNTPKCLVLLRGLSTSLGELVLLLIILTCRHFNLWAVAWTACLYKFFNSFIISYMHDVDWSNVEP